ncbi:hypothetical protein [Pseudomonas plecoglossicida]|uniref:hypothetical protein n=1 Tax=Pseudomonas plecoglossicida TaxID=70775 RepID=UPI0015E4749D|nr:hypothetical protein [Pseudomonas plecoglossicida]MBA1324544.1 hypothetical protein [Pseudomonas plecoglossicida]
MSKGLLHEVSSWKVEAKLEDTGRYFFHTDVVDKIASGAKSFVIGRKGSGKTAIAEHLTKNLHYSRFAKNSHLKTFPSRIFTTSKTKALQTLINI